MPVASINVLDHIDAAGTIISQIENVRPTPGIQLALRRAAGFPLPLGVHNRTQRAEVTFDSTQLKTLLDLTGDSIADLSGGNTDLWFRKATNLGRRDTSPTTGTRLRMANAGLVVSRITASQDREASAACRIFNPFDGTNEPLVPLGAQAITNSVTANEFFVAGPIFVNGAQINGVQEQTIDFGRTMIQRGGDGEIYHTFEGERSIAPVITARVTDLPWTTFGLNGLALTGVSVYLRKADTTNRVPDATPQHIKISAAAGIATLDDTSGGGENEAVSSIRLTLTAPDAGSPLITISTASAITS